MPRSNWIGQISFGLVSIPVLLFNSENKAEKISFHQIDKRNKARIKYQRINTETGKEVPWEDITKGYEYAKDNYLVLEQGELDRIAGENARTIAIENFVNEDSIDFIDIDKTYYLLPAKKGEKGYVILREALKQTKKIGIARVIISTKEYVAAIGCYQNALVLYLLRYHEEIKPLTDFDIPSDNLKEYKATPKEVDVAKQLIKSMSAKWQPAKFKDEYQEAVHEWVDKKMKNKPTTQMKQRSKAKVTGKEVNFVELLRQSLKSKGTKSTKGSKIKDFHVKKKSGHHKHQSLH